MIQDFRAQGEAINGIKFEKAWEQRLDAPRRVEIELAPTIERREQLRKEELKHELKQERLNKEELKQQEELKEPRK
jgi:hypothetical protein